MFWEVFLLSLDHYVCLLISECGLFGVFSGYCVDFMRWISLYLLSDICIWEDFVVGIGFAECYL